MKQNELIEGIVQKYEDISFSNFLEPERYLKFNKFKLVSYQHQQEPSPWMDAQNQIYQKKLLITQKPLSLKAKKCQFQAKNEPMHINIKTKKQFQEMHHEFKLNNTLVQFGVQYKSKIYKQPQIRMTKQKSKQNRNYSSKRIIQNVWKQRQQQQAFKTPKIKFLQRKYRIREGTSNGVRFRLPKTERTFNQTKKIEQEEKSEMTFFQNNKTPGSKYLNLRPIHSRDIRHRWFE